jgi:hypothetical protein
MSLLPLMAVNWPSITVLIFEKMLSTNGEMKFIPNVFYDNLLNYTGIPIVYEAALNDRFIQYGWDSSNFIYLSGRKVLIWFMIVVAYPFVAFMRGRYANKHRFCKVWEFAEKKFKYTMILRLLIMSYATFFLAAMLNIYMMEMATIENIISLFAALSFSIILLYLPIQILNIL